MNTKIKYMYRDADNYKDFTTVVVSGKITKEQSLLQSSRRSRNGTKV